MQFFEGHLNECYGLWAGSAIADDRIAIVARQHFIAPVFVPCAT